MTGYGELSKFVGLIENMNGRDKLSKALQYLTKLMAYELLTGNVELAKRLTSLSAAIGMARKCDRLFKTNGEIKKVIDVLNDDKINTTKQTLTILQAVGFAFYWYYDNRVFLIKAGFSAGDAKMLDLKANRWWFFGVIFQVILTYIVVVEAQNKRQIAKRDEQGAADEQLRTQKINLISQLGDFVCAFQTSGAAEMLLKRSINEGVVSAAGLLSAIATLYNIYPKK